MKLDAEAFKGEQRRQWDSVAAGWKKWWSLFEERSSHVSAHLIEEAGIRPGYRVLDIATGIGEPSITIARRILPGGHVIATDQSEQMLEFAKERAAGLTNIEFHRLDAEALGFREKSFDAVVCRWGLMFLPNISLALSDIKRYLVSGRRFATAVWDAPVQVNAFSLVFEVAGRVFQLPPPQEGATTLFGLGNGVLEKELENAGFSDIKSKKIEVDYEYPSLDSYIEYLKEIPAPLLALLENKPEEKKAEFWSEVSKELKPFITPEGKVKSTSIAVCASAQA